MRTGPENTPPPKVPSVWDYSDYREYLEAYLLAKRHGSRSFSVRQFCLKGSISTENYLLKIIRGQRNLGPKLAESFIRALPLFGTEAEYFRTLVELRLTKTVVEKEALLNRLERLRRRSRRGAPITDQTILRHWYISAIWELSSCTGFHLTPQSAVQALRNQISVQEAKEAIEYLLRKKYLVLKKERLEQGETPIITTSGKTDPVLRIHHKEALVAAQQAVDLPIEERGFFGLTIAIDRRRLPEIKTRLKTFMDDLQNELALDPSADSVYRINAHCFPLGLVDSSDDK